MPLPKSHFGFTLNSKPSSETGDPRLNLHREGWRYNQGHGSEQQRFVMIQELKGEPVSDYREFPPPVALAKHLVCLWAQTIMGSKVAYSQSVFPDGCVDLVVINDEPPTVVGPWTQPFVARLAPGTMIVGARFRPGHAPSLLGLSASTLLNQSVPLVSTSGRSVAARFQPIGEGRTLPARMHALQTALLAHLPHVRPADEVTTAAVQWLSRNPRGRIEELGRWTGFSSRQLQRRFTAAVGYGPKMFHSVLRFQRLLHLSSSANAPQNLAQFSADAGYADQAHMTREVRRFSGSVPTALFGSARSALQLSNLLNVTSDAAL